MSTASEQELIKCKHCGTLTPMLGTKLCDSCWELQWRILNKPEIAKKIIKDNNL